MLSHIQFVFKILLFRIFAIMQCLQRPQSRIHEYLVIPYRIQDYQKIIEFERFKKTLKMRVLAADDAITKHAAQIRAKYSGIKAMDALQLASAIISGCDVFLTNDKQLRQVEEIPVLLVDDL